MSRFARLAFLTFPHPGEYSLLIEIDEEPLLATNLTVSS